MIFPGRLKKRPTLFFPEIQIRTMALMKKRLIQFISILLISAVIISCQSIKEYPDYSDPQNWAYYTEGKDKEADVFLICPTVDMGEDGNLNMAMDDEETKESFVGALNMERGIYDDSAELYAPFYRQMTFPVYAERKAEEGFYLDIAYSDVKKAFLYYMENLNNGRPFIIAGFSQGAQLALMLLEDLFDDQDLQDSLIAAYCIGWKITEEDIADFPHLKMAEGEKDTGVIISFNTESEAVMDSIIVPEGTRTLSINPLNWKTDSSSADRSLNLGACFTDYSGNITQEIPFLTGAYLDPSRGTLKAIDIEADDYANALFPDGVYHLYDYQFFFRNLEENVKTRIEQYLEKNE